MSVLHRKLTGSADPATAAPQRDRTEPTATSFPDRAPLIRSGATGFVACVAAVASVVFIVFLVQNTGGVEVTFLWMHGSVPLALALLVAGICAATLTMVVGAARTGRERRLARRSR